MITFDVHDSSGEKRTIEVPENINLNLMEVLCASDYPIEATCGGMALCATCYVEVLQGMEQLAPRTDSELDMLDTLPNANAKSRLACQVKIDERMQNVSLQIKTEEK